MVANGTEIKWLKVGMFYPRSRFIELIIQDFVQLRFATFYDAYTTKPSIYFSLPISAVQRSGGGTVVQEIRGMKSHP
jgi:hypothetical protein